MFPEEAVFLGFDFGTKRMGVAVGQAITRSANALRVIPMRDGQPDWHIIDDLILQWQPNALVVGVPLNMDGSEQEMTKRARQFLKKLADRTQLPTYEVDERLTSKAVREELFERGGSKALKKADIDSLSAQMILQQWMAQ